MFGEWSGVKIAPSHHGRVLVRWMGSLGGPRMIADISQPQRVGSPTRCGIGSSLRVRVLDAMFKPPGMAILTHHDTMIFGFEF